MPVGYLPDMFGHIAQMPQILRRAGIGRAVVWRGVPAAIDRHAFTWRAPDGSSVRDRVPGRRLRQRRLPVRRPGPPRPRSSAGYVDGQRRAFYGDRSILAMYGTDHAVPSPRLADLVDARQRRRRRHRGPARDADATTSGRSTPSADPDGRPAIAADWTGELRSGARANMLMNVTSARIDLKVAAGARRARSSSATPSRWRRSTAAPGRRACSSSPGGGWSTTPPTTRSAAARTTRSSPRSSTRYAEAEQIGRGHRRPPRSGALAARRAARSAGRRQPVAGRPDRRGRARPRRARPTGRPSSSSSATDGACRPRSSSSVRRPSCAGSALRGARCPSCSRRRLHGRELFGHFARRPPRSDATTGRPRARPPRWTIRPRRPSFDVDDAPRRGRARRRPAIRTRPWDVTVVPRRPAAAPGRRAAARRSAATTVRPVEAATRAPRPTAERRRRRRPDRSRNGLVAVDGRRRRHVPARRRRRRASTASGRIVDGGDFGDSYNYGPPADDRSSSTPSVVVVQPIERGPAPRQRSTSSRRYDWPVGLDAGRRGPLATTTAPTEVTTTARAPRRRAVRPRQRVASTNPSRDHRVRWHLPLPARDGPLGGRGPVRGRRARPDGRGAATARCRCRPSRPTASSTPPA